MLHVATVHWKSDRWIDIQSKYLRANIREEFRVYAALTGVPGDHAGKYAFVMTDDIESHPLKLDMLAERIGRDAASPDDLVMFLDGDAFPVGDAMAFVRAALKTAPLVAVQRLENNGDRQPHPCFCVTTVRFWREIGGTWDRGYEWKDLGGKPRTDVGGNLLGILETKGIAWKPMLRSNRVNLHPLFFGVYEDVVYHHGAGYRDPISRVDLARSRSLLDRWSDSISRRLPIRMPFGRRHLTEENAALSAEVFESIRTDPQFYRRFL